MVGILCNKAHPNFDAINDIGRMNLENPYEMQKKEKRRKGGTREEKSLNVTFLIYSDCCQSFKFLDKIDIRTEGINFQFR